MAKEYEKQIPYKIPAGVIKGTLPADPCGKEKKAVRAAAGIAGQILVHFGAGFGAEREKVKPAPGGNTQIFDSPVTAAVFTDLLISSVIKHLGDLHWDTDSIKRDGICQTAFLHGQLAYQQSAGAPLDWATLYSTLQEIKAMYCPSGSAGGGIACDF